MPNSLLNLRFYRLRFQGFFPGLPASSHHFGQIFGFSWSLRLSTDFWIWNKAIFSSMNFGLLFIHGSSTDQTKNLPLPWAFSKYFINFVENDLITWHTTTAIVKRMTNFILIAQQFDCDAVSLAGAYLFDYFFGEHENRLLTEAPTNTLRGHVSKPEVDKKFVLKIHRWDEFSTKRKLECRRLHFEDSWFQHIIQSNTLQIKGKHSFARYRKTILLKNNNLPNWKQVFFLQFCNTLLHLVGNKCVCTMYLLTNFAKIFFVIMEVCLVCIQWNCITMIHTWHSE